MIFRQPEKLLPNISIFLKDWSNYEHHHLSQPKLRYFTQCTSTHPPRWYWIEYLKNPPSETTLRDLIKRMGITPRQLLRTNVPPYETFDLQNEKLSDDELISAMLREPILINRPIVVSEKGVKLCRPSETVLAFLPPFATPFVKEDGEIINHKE